MNYNKYLGYVPVNSGFHDITFQKIRLFINYKHKTTRIMQEALKSLIKYALTEIGLNKIIAKTLSYNIRSINLLENLNFNFDRIKKDFHCFSIQ